MKWPKAQQNDTQIITKTHNKASGKMTQQIDGDVDIQNENTVSRPVMKWAWKWNRTQHIRLLQIDKLILDVNSVMARLNHHFLVRTRQKGGKTVMMVRYPNSVVQNTISVIVANTLKSSINSREMRWQKRLPKALLSYTQHNTCSINEIIACSLCFAFDRFVGRLRAK